MLLYYSVYHVILLYTEHYNLSPTAQSGWVQNDPRIDDCVHSECSIYVTMVWLRFSLNKDVFHAKGL